MYKKAGRHSFNYPPSFLSRYLKRLVRSLVYLPYKTAIDYERELKKLNKAELDLKFLFRCREEDLHPKFTRWKNFNTYDDSGKRKRYRKVLSEAISDKHRKVRELRKSVSEKEKVMNETTTFMKRKLIRCAILDVIRRDTVKVKQRHDKKFDSLLEGKKKRDQLIANELLHHQPHRD